MSLGISVIYSNNDYSRLTKMMKFLTGILKEYDGNCKLSVSKGWLIKDCREYVLMERKDGNIRVNKHAEEKDLFYDLEIPYVESSFEVE